MVVLYFQFEASQSFKQAIDKSKTERKFLTIDRSFIFYIISVSAAIFVPHLKVPDPTCWIFVIAQSYVPF